MPEQKLSMKIIDDKVKQIARERASKKIHGSVIPSKRFSTSAIEKRTLSVVNASIVLSSST
jgi:hypothetical protein